MESDEGCPVSPERLREIRSSVEVLSDGDSTQDALESACDVLANCSTWSPDATGTNDGTAAARLGAVGVLVRLLHRTESPWVLVALYGALYGISTGNSKVMGRVVNDHASELIPLLKELAHSCECNSDLEVSVCYGLDLLSGYTSAGPQLCSTASVLMDLMRRPGATNDQFLIATSVLANFARAATLLKDQRFWRALDSIIDSALLTDLAISSAAEERKGSAEAVLLTMYGSIPGHSSISKLEEHNVAENFVLPCLRHAYDRSIWFERNFYFDPSHFFLFSCASKPPVLASRLVELGAVKLAVDLLKQPETNEDEDIFDLLWLGKASALNGLANMMSHLQLRDDVAEGAGGLPLEELALHKSADIRRAAARVAFELQGDPPQAA